MVVHALCPASFVFPVIYFTLLGVLGVYALGSTPGRQHTLFAACAGIQALLLVAVCAMAVVWRSREVELMAMAAAAACALALLLALWHNRLLSFAAAVVPYILLLPSVVTMVPLFALSCLHDAAWVQNGKCLPLLSPLQ